MGYKKLDEVMELLNDELDGFNKSIERLEKLTQNVDNINIEPDTSKIESLLEVHLSMEKAKNSRYQESLGNIGKQISKGKLVPKAQLWFHYGIWFISLIIIGYLAFRVSRIDDVKEKAFAKGKQQVIHSLRKYFDLNPDHYQSYQKWVKQQDSIPNQK